MGKFKADSTFKLYSTQLFCGGNKSPFCPKARLCLESINKVLYFLPLFYNIICYICVCV